MARRWTFLALHIPQSDEPGPKSPPRISRITRRKSKMKLGNRCASFNRLRKCRETLDISHEILYIDSNSVCTSIASLIFSIASRPPVRKRKPRSQNSPQILTICKAIGVRTLCTKRKGSSWKKVQSSGSALPRGTDSLPGNRGRTFLFTTPALTAMDFDRFVRGTKLNLK